MLFSFSYYIAFLTDSFNSSSRTHHFWRSLRPLISLQIQGWRSQMRGVLQRLLHWNLISSKHSSSRAIWFYSSIKLSMTQCCFKWNHRAFKLKPLELLIVVLNLFLVSNLAVHWAASICNMNIGKEDQNWPQILNFCFILLLTTQTKASPWHPIGCCVVEFEWMLVRCVSSTQHSATWTVVWFLLLKPISRAINTVVKSPVAAVSITLCY